MRRSRPALSLGSWEAVACENNVLAYRRSFEGDELLVALNFDSGPVSLRLAPGSKHRVVLSTHLDRRGGSEGDEVALRSDEGLVLEPDA